jgi:hypothetical protein
MTALFSALWGVAGVLMMFSDQMIPGLLCMIISTLYLGIFQIINRGQE